MSTTPHTYTEYIVMFNAYYTSDARDGFISAALKLHPDWSIVPRSNPSQDYPSDFSLVQLRAHVPRAVTSLEHHPTVKRVTPQRKLTRMLAFSSEGVCVYVCECVCVCVCACVFAVTDLLVVLLATTALTLFSGSRAVLC